jgi:hypothetical protein
VGREKRDAVENRKSRPGRDLRSRKSPQRPEKLPGKVGAGADARTRSPSCSPPHKVAAGEAAGVDAPRIGKLKKRRSTVDSQKPKGTGDGRKSGQAGEDDRVDGWASKIILPHGYYRCQGKVGNYLQVVCLPRDICGERKLADPGQKPSDHQSRAERSGTDLRRPAPVRCMCVCRWGAVTNPSG